MFTRPRRARLGDGDHLEALGATRCADQPNDDVIVFLDPEGNELCLLR